MRKAFLFLSMFIVVGLTACSKPTFTQMQAAAEQRLNCMGQGFLIDSVGEVRVYPSGAVEVFHIDPYADHSVFLSPSDRLTFVEAIEDLPEYGTPYADLRPRGAWILSGQPPLEWTCVFKLQIHVRLGDGPRIINNQH